MSSGEGDSLLAWTAVEVDAAFSFCDSGDKSASFHLQKTQTGDNRSFFNNATSNLATFLTFQAPSTLVTVFDYLTVLLDAKAIIALQIAIGSAIFN
jgi:hypothetical protein